MPGVLLAPYNDSMRLGQGYNSFLHTPCVHDAVRFTKEKLVTRPAGGAGSTSQVVNYTSRFVDKISEVAKSMNVSAGSSIKSGGIVASGSSLALDETKFASSHLNAVVSVKVMNQTTELLGSASFMEPEPGLSIDSENFFRLYGNCYISGFIEGGDLTGIVSVRILDIANKAQIERDSGNSGDQKGFTLNEGPGTPGSSSSMSKTETTITVSWSGGGQIKPENEAWTLESLYSAAAAFPSKVAQCPQRTWAILTPYYHTKNFLSWAQKVSIKVPQFDATQVYANDLLDMYMEYKNCVSRIQSVMMSPLDYVRSPAANPIGLSMPELLELRKTMKGQMKAINNVVGLLALKPDNADDIEHNASIEPPELWSYRLPILRNVAEENAIFSPAEAAEELAKFSFIASDTPKEPGSSVSTSETNSVVTPQTSVDVPVQTAKRSVQSQVQQPIAPVEPPLLAPYASDVEKTFNEDEKAMVLSPSGRKKYAKYRFDKLVGSPGGGLFCGANELSSSMTPIGWPKRIEINWVEFANTRIIGWIKTSYERMVLTHGNDRGTLLATLTLDFEADEYVVKVRMAKGDHLTWGFEGVAFIELTTSHGRVVAALPGSSDGKQVVECSAPSNFPGLKGFMEASGDVVDRLGPIWGSF